MIGNCYPNESFAFERSWEELWFVDFLLYETMLHCEDAHIGTLNLKSQKIPRNLHHIVILINYYLINYLRKSYYSRTSDTNPSVTDWLINRTDNIKLEYVKVKHM